MKSVMLAACLLAGPVFANDVLYSDLSNDPIHLYNALVGYTIEGSDPGPFLAQGFSLLPTISEQLEGIDIAIGVGVGTHSMVITLNSDNSGLPGSILESWKVTGLPGAGGCCGLQTLTSNLAIDLFTGTRYWVLATPGASDTDGIWSLSNTGVTGPRVNESDPAGPFKIFDTDQPSGAFAVIGNGVQISWVCRSRFRWGLTGLGLGVLGVLSRRRRKRAA